MLVPGPEEKVIQMGAALGGFNSSACFHNPALLGLAPSPSFLDLEMGYATAFYSYKRPNFDPVRVKLRSPTLTAGYLTQKTDRPFRLAISFLPERNSKIHIPGLPNESSGEVGVFDIKLSEAAFTLGLGASFELTKQHFLGLTFLYSYASRNLDVAFAAQDEHLFNSRAQSQNLNPLLGYVYRSDHSWSLGLAYLFASTRRSVGSFRDQVEAVSKGPPQVIYNPATLRTALSFNAFSNLDLTFAYNKVLGSKGAGLYKDGIQSLNETADLHDASEYGLSLKTQIWGSELLAGLSYRESIWGNGLATESSTGKSLGVEFGLIEGLPRWGGGLLLRRQLSSSRKDSHYEFGVGYLSGDRKVSERGAGEGKYDFSLVTINAGLSYPM